MSTERDRETAARIDLELMLRVQQDDREAFGELVRRYQNRIVGLAYRYLGSAADAEDVAQDVFLRVHRARESYQPTARFSTWIHRITVNASLNRIRSRKARKKIGSEMPMTAEGATAADAVPADELGAHERMERDELAVVLRAIVDRLPERQRTALLLNKYQDLSYEEVAASMELTVSAVKSLLTRARNNVRRELVPYLERGALETPGEEL